MNLCFTGKVSDTVRSMNFRAGQKVVTENHVVLRFKESRKSGNVEWQFFEDETGKEYIYRMTTFPFLSPMYETRRNRDRAGLIDTRTHLLKYLNREIEKGLKALR